MATSSVKSLALIGVGFLIGSVTTGVLVGIGLGTEGTKAGECTDKADNDADGKYDCDDADCFNSPDCLAKRRKEAMDKALDRGMSREDAIEEGWKVK